MMRSVNSEIAIKVDNVSKNFKLPHEKNSTIKGAFVNMLKGKRGKTIEVQHALRDISFEIKKVSSSALSAATAAAKAPC